MPGTCASMMPIMQLMSGAIFVQGRKGRSWPETHIQVKKYASCCDAVLCKQVCVDTCRLGESFDFWVRKSFRAGKIRSSFTLEPSESTVRRSSTPHRCCMAWLDLLRNMTILSVCTIARGKNMIFARQQAKQRM